jgi:hypothetical protein
MKCQHRSSEKGKSIQYTIGLVNNACDVTSIDEGLHTGNGAYRGYDLDDVISALMSMGLSHNMLAELSYLSVNRIDMTTRAFMIYPAGINIKKRTNAVITTGVTVEDGGNGFYDT